MAKRGRGGPALVIAALASFVGGLIGVIGFVLVAPFSRLALEFGAPELFLVSVLGMALVASFAGRDPAKALRGCCPARQERRPRSPPTPWRSGSPAAAESSGRAPSKASQDLRQQTTRSPSPR